jgi:GAF domain-containing protein
MAETIPDLRNVPKGRAYAELKGHADAILDGIDDNVTAMATIAALLHHAFAHLWTGFYRVVVPGKLLRVGPYQGSLGCLDIEFGRGV